MKARRPTARPPLVRDRVLVPVYIERADVRALHAAAARQGLAFSPGARATLLEAAGEEAAPATETTASAGGRCARRVKSRGRRAARGDTQVAPDLGRLDS